MDVIKRHLVFIVSGIAGLAGIALGVTGLRAMPELEQAMQEATGVYANLEPLPQMAVNAERLEEEDRRIQSVLDDRAAVIEAASALYPYEPLVEGALPCGTPLQLIEFRNQFAVAMQQLLDSLTSGGPATSLQVQNMRDKIEDENAEIRAGLRSPKFTGPPKDASGTLTGAGIREDAIARAAIHQAQRIYCYVTHWSEENIGSKIYSSLEYFAPLRNLDTADPPWPDEVWNGQLSYWIQKDIIDTIRDMNEEAATAAKDAGRHPWVGIMPVKEILSIRVGNALVTTQDLVAGGSPESREAVLPPSSAGLIFTKNASTGSYDVVQFSLKLVMDQRDVTEFVERLCNNRFHTLLRVAYVSVPPNKNFRDRVYGSEPVVQVVMDFETILLGEKFRRYMPPLVRENNGVNCRDVDECRNCDGKNS